MASQSGERGRAESGGEFADVMRAANDADLTNSAEVDGVLEMLRQASETNLDDEKVRASLAKALRACSVAERPLPPWLTLAVCNRLTFQTDAERQRIWQYKLNRARLLALVEAMGDAESPSEKHYREAAARRAQAGDRVSPIALRKFCQRRQEDDPEWLARWRKSFARTREVARHQALWRRELQDLKQRIAAVQGLPMDAEQRTELAAIMAELAAAEERSRVEDELSHLGHDSPTNVQDN